MLNVSRWQMVKAVPLLFQELINATRRPPLDNLKHVRAGIDWLATAQDATADHGVSKGFAPHRGWLPSYVETTGYIIPTMFDCSARFGWEECSGRAVKMAEWELSCQYESGAFPGCQVNAGAKPLVFDTGMVLFGLIRTYEETKDKTFLVSAQKAADWLIAVQENSGEWRKATLSNQPRTYHARVAWALLELSRITDLNKYKRAALKNLDWTANQQLSNGWFKNNSFYGEDQALTHTIAYTTRGLLESGVILGKNVFVEAATKTARAVYSSQHNDGSIPGSFKHDWRPTMTFSCLSGNAQIAIIWLRLFQITGDKAFFNTAVRTINYLKTMQNMATPYGDIKGALTSTYPIFRGYMKFFYSNWAVKFFIDSLLLLEELERPIQAAR